MRYLYFALLLITLLFSACQKEAASPTSPILSASSNSIIVGDTLLLTVSNKLENYTCLTWSYTVTDSLGNFTSGSGLTVSEGDTKDLSWSFIPQNTGIYHMLLVASNCENKKVDCHQNCPSADNGNSTLIVVQ